MTSSRKAACSAVILSALVLAGGGPLQAQVLQYAALPLGWCNILGPSSPAGTAMGETVFGGRGPQAGFLNPGVLGLDGLREASLVFRLAHSTYRTRMYDPVSMTNDLMKWRRDTVLPEWGGFAFAAGGWRFAAGYSLAEEYNRPEVSFEPGRPESQSGRLHGLNAAVARSFSDSLGIGISFSYRFGKIDRTYDRRLWSGEYLEQHYRLNGLAVNFGFAWKLSERVRLGLALRPPVKMDLEFEYLRTLEDPPDTQSGSAEGFYKLPLAVVMSAAVRIDERSSLTADLSYWAWNTVNSGGGSIPMMVPDGWVNPLRAGVGMEHDVKLRPGFLKGLRLRAGYIHDRQHAWGVALDFLTGGFGLDLGKLEVEAAAKIALAPVEEYDRIHTSFFQLGVRHKF